MNPRVKTVKAIADYKLEIRFSNGKIGIYDCSPLLGFGIFSELKDIHYFRQVRTAFGTVVWPNDQDICPDTLYMDSIKIKKVSEKPHQRQLVKNREQH